MPGSQVSAYNRLVALMNGVNSGLGPYVVLIRALVDQASIRLGWLMTVKLLTIRGKKSVAIADELTEALIGRLRDGIACQWQEIRSVEILVQEVADEFEGEDPMTPELRAVFEQAKTGLTDVAETLDRCGIETEMPEPTEDVLDKIRLVAHRELKSRRLTL